MKFLTFNELLFIAVTHTSTIFQTTVYKIIHLKYTLTSKQKTLQLLHCQKEEKKINKRFSRRRTTNIGWPREVVAAAPVRSLRTIKAACGSQKQKKEAEARLLSLSLSLSSQLSFKSRCLHLSRPAPELNEVETPRLNGDIPGTLDFWICSRSPPWFLPHCKSLPGISGHCAPDEISS